MKRVLLCLMVLAGTSIAGGSVACASETQGAVVVVVDDGSVVQRCAAASGTGIDALRSAGFKVDVKDFGPELGAAVCKIDGTGNDAGSCPGGNGHWHYWVWDGSSWKESEVGASQRSISPGTADGWVWETDTEPTPPPDDPRPCVAARPAPTDDAGIPIAWVATGVGMALAILPIAAVRRRR